jgi:hypothetical protein
MMSAPVKGRMSPTNPPSPPGWSLSSSRSTLSPPTVVPGLPVGDAVVVGLPVGDAVVVGLVEGDAAGLVAGVVGGAVGGVVGDDVGGGGVE